MTSKQLSVFTLTVSHRAHILRLSEDLRAQSPGHPEHSMAQDGGWLPCPMVAQRTDMHAGGVLGGTQAHGTCSRAWHPWLLPKTQDQMWQHPEQVSRIYPSLTPSHLSTNAFWELSWLQGPTGSHFPKDVQLLSFLESLAFRVCLKARPAGWVLSQLCPSSLSTGDAGQADCSGCLQASLDQSISLWCPSDADGTIWGQ